MALYVGGTSLLLHGNGADGSTVFTDETGKTVTAYGNARISTAQSKFGGSSMYFDGSGDLLVVPNSADFQLYGLDYTIECWFYRTRSGFTEFILGYHAVSGYGYALYCASDGTAFFQNAGGGTVATPPNVVPLNAWTHIAVSKYGSTNYIYVNGVMKGSTAGNIFTNVTDGMLYIAYRYDGIYPVMGYVQDIRITKNRYVYSTNFTVPADALSLIYPEQIAIQAHDTGLTKLAKYDPSQIKPVMYEVKDDLQDRLPYGLWKTPGSFNEWKGRGIITGTVAEKALPANTPLRRLVRLHREPDGAFVRATWSDDAGNYVFNGVRADHKYFVTSFDYTGTYRAVIADNLTPDVLP